MKAIVGEYLKGSLVAMARWCANNWDQSIWDQPFIWVTSFEDNDIWNLYIWDNIHV